MSTRIAGRARSTGRFFSPRAPAARGLALFLFALAACVHRKPALQTFHYRAAAQPHEIGERWSPQLDGDAKDGFARAIKFHIEQTGVLQLSTQTSSPKVAVLIYTAGKTALVQTRAGTAIETPPLQGDVFVVVRALRGSGPVTVQVDSFVAPSAPGVQPAPPTPDVAPAKEGANASDPSDPNALPLDDLLAN